MANSLFQTISGRIFSRIKPLIINITFVGPLPHLHFKPHFRTMASVIPSDSSLVEKAKNLAPPLTSGKHKGQVRTVFLTKVYSV